MKLTRFAYGPNGTFGILEVEGREYYTVEPPWADNRVNESCIPEGTYPIRRDDTGRFRYFRLENVKGRTAIELHEGRTMRHSDGCIIPGRGLGMHNGLWAVMNSSAAIRELVNLFPKDWEGEIEITSVFKAKKQKKKKTEDE